MASTRLLVSISLLAALVAVSASAGPTAHALELSREGTLYFVDLERARVLRFEGTELSVASTLDGVPPGDHMQNLVLGLDGQLYLGLKKSTWKIGPDGRVETAKPPAELKVLFNGRPGDLAPDGSVYTARDFKNIERSMPGAQPLAVLITDNISKIHSIAVTPYGRVLFSNNSEVAKLKADGTVEILVELAGDEVLGLAALGENEILMLLRSKSGGVSLVHVDSSGTVKPLISAEQIASASSDGPVEISSGG
jgi:hypothetical protein